MVTGRADLVANLGSPPEHRVVTSRMPASVHPIANAKATEKDPLDPNYDKAIITELRDQLEELRRDVSCRELGRRLFTTTDAAFGAAVVATACANEGKAKKRWFI